jgi:hypothetical protein
VISVLSKCYRILMFQELTCYRIANCLKVVSYERNCKSNWSRFVLGLWKFESLKVVCYYSIIVNVVFAVSWANETQSRIGVWWSRCMMATIYKTVAFSKFLELRVYVARILCRSQKIFRRAVLMPKISNHEGEHNEHIHHPVEKAS